MTHNKTLRNVAAILAVTAAAFSMNAAAQSTNPTGPGNSNTNKAGEAYPNDANAANANKPKLGVVQKAQDSQPAQATKRVARKSKNAVKRAGHKTANVIRNAGNKIGSKLPPEPAPAGGVKP
jgi:hypothetical protein